MNEKKRLELLRDKLKLNWGELAKYIGISRSMLDFIRDGRREAGLQTLRKIELAEKRAMYGIPTDVIIKSRESKLNSAWVTDDLIAKLPVSERINRIVGKLKYSDNELAISLGVCLRDIPCLKNGKYTISEDIIKKIINVERENNLICDFYDKLRYKVIPELKKHKDNKNISDQIEYLENIVEENTGMKPYE